MNKRIMMAALGLMVLGLAYYFGFHAPVQEELSQIAARTAAVEAQIGDAAGTLAAMNEMESALAALPEQPWTEVAPYDNQAAVLSQLNRILTASEEYSLSFADPSIASDGMVRRNVLMQFRCGDFGVLTSIVRDLTHSPWRCQISSISLSAPDDLFSGAVTASATVTFFESTRLQ